MQGREQAQQCNCLMDQTRELIMMKSCVRMHLRTLLDKDKLHQGRAAGVLCLTSRDGDPLSIMPRQRASCFQGSELSAGRLLWNTFQLLVVQGQLHASVQVAS